MSSYAFPPRDLRPTIRKARSGGRTMAPQPRKVRTKEVGAIRARIALFTYALSRLPPRQLPLLALYASGIVYAAEKGWIAADGVGKAGASIVGVLSMVTGLLLSHRFSSAVSKWDEGKKVWVAIRTNIRDAIRLISITPLSSTRATPQSPTSDDPSLISISASTSEMSSPAKPPTGLSFGTSPPRISGMGSKSRNAQAESSKDPLTDRVDELTGLFVGFAFALQHHLHGTRPLPQAPLCDLLPAGYLASLKRTEARVRFAEDNASSTSAHMAEGDSAILLDDLPSDNLFRPGLRRRGTGPPSTEEKASHEDWELSDLKDRAEEAVSQLAEAVAGLHGEEDKELRRQLDQLQQFSQGAMGAEDEGKREKLGLSGPKTKSNLANPCPPNLPLAVLKLMEAYLIGLAEVPLDQGGWSEAKRDRGLGIVKSLSGHLSEAERLASTSPPLPLTLHSYHLLTIYLFAIPPSLLCAISGPALVLITLLAGWCLLGLEALVGEVGGVFGGSESYHPLPMMTNEILVESLDMNPGFTAFYRGRMVARLGEDEEVAMLDRRRKGREEWAPVFG